MENMLEHSIAAKTISVTIVKPILWLAITFGFYPAYDYLLQVTEHAPIFLDPWWKELFVELKYVLGVLVSFLASVKLAFGIKELFKKNNVTLDK